MTLKITTEAVAASSDLAAADLLDVLQASAQDLPSEERFAFVRDGEGLVAWGVAAPFAPPPGDDRFEQARTWLETLTSTAEVDDPVALLGSGAVALASFTFDPEEGGSVVVVPRRVVGRRDGVTFVTRIDPLADATPCPEPRVRTTTAPGGSDDQRPAVSDRPRYAGSTLRDDRWLEAVAQALGTIAAGGLQKVVLARDLRLWSRAPFDPHATLEGLQARFPSCFTFLVEGLLGASPELLLSRQGPDVRSRVLAGTAPRDADPAADAQLGEVLLGSEKDRWEHDLALRSVTDALGPFCSTLEAPDVPSLIRLENVQHLGTDVSGRLTDPVHALDLLARLHPTAAVAGTPPAEAMRAIRELEGMQRGRYTGPVGWCTADGDGEFAIALRCGVFDGARARLFAGAGVVAGSLPEAELTETWLKLRAMTAVLEDIT